ERWRPPWQCRGDPPRPSRPARPAAAARHRAQPPVRRGHQRRPSHPPCAPSFPPYPPVLAGALAKRAAAPPTPSDPGLDHLWLVAPRPDPATATHPPVAERIASLRDL